MNYFQREKKARELVGAIKMEADILQYRADTVHTIDWPKIYEGTFALRNFSEKLIEIIGGSRNG